MEELNPIVALAELVQSRHGANIETKVLGKTGADHCPTVEVEITLPTGEAFKAYGSNKKLAKQKAAKEALDYLESVKVY